MKIEIYIEDSEFGRSEEMTINGHAAMTVYPLCECPEDATIERELYGPSDVIDYIKGAYEAGKRGDILEIEYTGDLED